MPEFSEINNIVEAVMAIQSAANRDELHTAFGRAADFLAERRDKAKVAADNNWRWDRQALSALADGRMKELHNV